MARRDDPAKVLLAVLLLSWPAVVIANDPQDWFTHLNRLEFWERLAEIRAVSELPKSAQSDRVPVLKPLPQDKDQSVRLTAAKEIAEIRDVSQTTLDLINNFKYQNREEGMGYVEAVAVFGDQALPSLQSALESKSWLVRVRASDALRIVSSNLYLDGECKIKAP